MVHVYEASFCFISPRLLALPCDDMHLFLPLPPSNREPVVPPELFSVSPQQEAVEILNTSIRLQGHLTISNRAIPT